ncbi:hypothetical protein [Singulisphaera acidiphila]|uniref:Uncharacterized protein n=1 Tax=Singulisphaera acidiphila (strain ATCC BAA-1392 / DSM 18658 / VKM B-2454 / MOB10) TaxID=886293 RepID=L0D7F8_SINAD|nr:hypothetical protein [Singulisphaera acidiphila]AGA25334.1 hypothetical protein Sinac_0930 [Singulisphaera acidiphila DSM 18658]
MRFRVSLRLLMVLVALAALGVGPIYRYTQTLWQRSRDYAESAKISALSEKIHLTRAKTPRFGPLEKEAARELADWHAKRSAKYKRAIYRPWIVIVDEPQPPSVPEATVPLPPIAEIAKKEKTEMTKQEDGEESNQAVRKIIEHKDRLRRHQTDGTKMTKEEADQIIRDVAELFNGHRHDRENRKAAREAEVARFRDLATP